MSNSEYDSRVSDIIKEIKNERKMMIRSQSEHERARVTRKTDRSRIVNDALLEWLDELDRFIVKEKNLKMKIEAETEMQRKYEMYRKMLKEIKKLNARCERAVIPRRDVGLDFFLNWKTVCFEFKSTIKAWDQLWEALNDNDGSHVIGLYGERGSGKTTLAMAVVRKANYYDDFEKAIYISVSQDRGAVLADREIRQKIAHSLRLKINDLSSFSEATTLCDRLLNGRYLVILDGVGAKLDFEDIGIPCNSNNCKILLITRQQGVCTLMNCQREIPLNPLSTKEALKMFKKYSVIDDESPSDLLNVAKNVAFECKGLPGTIKDVGSSLKNKPIKEWKASLNNLRSCYQVFLSFRGKDTRYSFTGSLYYALCREGFKTFMDEDGLGRGTQISENLIKAIEDSSLSIIVFSENYAFSSWCLEELVTILECRETKNQQILPIFYKVDPSDIRHLNNKYGNAMAAHEERFGYNSHQVKRWRSALSEVVKVSGMHYKTNRYEYKFIQEIVEEANNIKSSLGRD